MQPPSTLPHRPSLMAAIIMPALCLAIILAVLFVAPRTIVTTGGSQLSPDESRRLDNLSSALLKQSRFADALQPASQLQEAYPTNPAYIERLANLYHALGRFEDEAECWNEYMDVASTPTDACPQIGRAYQFAGAKAQAVAAFQRCLNLDSSNTDFIVYLASALERDGQFEAAEALFRKGAALSPTYADMQIGIASTRLYEGHIVEALYELQQLVKEHPGNGDAWLVLGVAYFKNNQFGQAESALHYGQTLSPKNAEFAVALGDLAEAQKHPDEAHLQYARALQLDPHNEEAAAHLQPAYLRWVPAGLWSRLRRARG